MNACGQGPHPNYYYLQTVFRELHPFHCHHCYYYFTQYFTLVGRWKKYVEKCILTMQTL